MWLVPQESRSLVPQVRGVGGIPALEDQSSTWSSWLGWRVYVPLDRESHPPWDKEPGECLSCAFLLALYPSLCFPGSEEDGFTPWSPWTPCSKSCSDPDLPAIKTRMRFCQEGFSCTGSSFQERECNLPQCMGENHPA